MIGEGRRFVNSYWTPRLGRTATQQPVAFVQDHRDFVPCIAGFDRLIVEERRSATAGTVVQAV